ncbi:unnamed protein product [Scytosiphon promiscuus]
MDLRERATADEKPRRRGSGANRVPGGGSKKSTRRKPPSSSHAAVLSSTGTGGDRARGHGIDPDRDSISGGLAARPDLGTAQSKDPTWPDQNESGSRARSVAKSVRRGSEQEGSRRRDVGGGLGREQRKTVQRGEPQVTVMLSLLSNFLVCRRWKSDASSTLTEGSVRNTTPLSARSGRPFPQKVSGLCTSSFPNSVNDDYSDEFDGEDEGPPSAGGTKTVSAAASAARPSSSRGTGPNDQVQAPHGKALEELRDSLRQENDIARERKVTRPNTNVHGKAEAKSSTSSRPAIRGAKGAKGTKSAAAAAAVGGGATSGESSSASLAAEARGTFSVDSPSAERKEGRRRTSGFRMSDAKALTRALAKGDPRTERVLAIRAACRLEVTSSRIFDQAPILPIDLYHRMLRGQPAMIRQAGSQTNEDARSVDVQTDEIFRVDKEAQFHLGHDDTALENLMRRLRSNRRGPAHLDHSPSAGMGESKGGDEGKGHQRTVAEEDGAVASTTTFKGLYNGRKGVDQDAFSAPRYGKGVENGGSGGGGLIAGVGEAAALQPQPPPLRLGKFLRQASVVMETLCEENLLYASAASSSPLEAAAGMRGEEEAHDDRQGRSLFSERASRGAEGWEEVGGAGSWLLGPGVAAPVDTGRPVEEEKRPEADGVSVGNCDTRVGPGRLLEGSKVVGIEFSRVKRSMLVTAHARPASQSWKRRRSADGSGGGGDSSNIPEYEAILEGCGVICVWNADSPKAAPVSVLCGEGLFSCLCLPLHHAHTVVAGTAEGCVLLWDLREPASSSRAAESRSLRLRCGIRSPTYSTAGGGGGDAGTSGPGGGHASTVVSVIPIPVAAGGGMSGNGGFSGEGFISLGEVNSFQIASLDDRGTVSIWLASEVSRADEGGSQSDLGLSPGGRIRLALSKSLHPGAQVQHTTLGGSVVSDMGGSGPVQSGGGGELNKSSFRRTTTAANAAATARAIAFSPRDPNRLLVGDSSDCVRHTSRLGQAPPPKVYRPPRRRQWGSGRGRHEEGQGQEERALGGVACLAFSPYFHEYFLTGCGDGSVRLYKDDSAGPLTVWEGDLSADTGNGTSASSWPPGISSLAWSEHRPAVFFVLDTSGAIHAFDLLQDGAGAVATERYACPAESGPDARDHPPHFTEGRTTVESSETTFSARARMALSTETLATGSRPKVALAFGGRVFTRVLAGRMFRQSTPSPAAAMEDGVYRDRSHPDPKDSSDREVVASERARMKEWLEEVLWA